MKVKYRGPIIKNNQSANIVFEDCYIRKDNLYYQQIYQSMPGNQYKILIQINSYEDQSSGSLFVLRPTGWIEYLKVEISLLTCCQWSRYHKDITTNEDALSDFRNDAMEMIRLISSSNRV